MACGVHEADLSALLDGELDALIERRVRDHLAVCGSCRREHSRLRALSLKLRLLEEPLASSPDFVRRVARAAAGARRGPARRRPAALPLLLARPVALAASLLLLLGLSAVVLLVAGPGSAPAPAGMTGGLSGAGSAGDVRPALPEPPDRPEVAVGEGPDYGAPLPRPEPPVVPPALRGEDLYRALGLAREGDGFLSPEAFARRRAHLEEEELLARAEERRLARERTEAGPPRATNPVAGLLASLSPGEARQGGGLEVVVLRDGTGSVGIPVVSAEHALAEGILTVSESRASGRIAARNSDPRRHVYLAAGEVLSGGHQDRLLTRPVLIPPRSQVALPVLCCEAGRSVGPEDRFGKSPGMASPAIRGLLAATGDQAAIWERVNVELDRGGAKSGTSALRAAFSGGLGPKRSAALLPGFREALADPNAVGFLVFAGDRFLGGEVFGDHDLLVALGPRALRSYLLAPPVDGEGAGIRPAEAAALLSRVAAGSFYETPGATFGREIGFDADGLCGTALVPLSGGRPLSVSILPWPEGAPVRPPRGMEGDGSAPRTGTEAPPPPVPGPESGEEPVEERMRERRGPPQVPGELKPPERRPEAPGAGGGPGARSPGAPGGGSGARPGEEPRSLPAR